MDEVVMSDVGHDLDEDLNAQLANFLSGEDVQAYQGEAAEAARRLLTVNISFKDATLRVPSALAAEGVVRNNAAEAHQDLADLASHPSPDQQASIMDWEISTDPRPLRIEATPPPATPSIPPQLSEQQQDCFGPALLQLPLVNDLERTHGDSNDGCQQRNSWKPLPSVLPAGRQPSLSPQQAQQQGQWETQRQLSSPAPCLPAAVASSIQHGPVAPPPSPTPATAPGGGAGGCEYEESRGRDGISNLPLAGGSEATAGAFAEAAAPAPAGPEAAAAEQLPTNKPAKRPTTGRYKRPEQEAAEKRQREQHQARIRQLEGLVGQLQAQLRGLRAENAALRQKAFVLARRLSFKNHAEEAVRKLRQSTSLEGGCDVETTALSPAALQAQLEGACRGLPPPAVLDSLRSTTLQEALNLYRGFVGRVRGLLYRIDAPASPSDKAAAEQDLNAIFTLEDTASTFVYLQIVNPRLMAQLMAARLDVPGAAQQAQQDGRSQRAQHGGQQHQQQEEGETGRGGGGDYPTDYSPSADRGDLSHWCGALDAMQLSDEQFAQLILLTHLYCQRLEQLKSRKMEVAQRLYTQLTEELEEGGYQEEGGGLRRGSAAELAAAAELASLLEAEYWARFDFMGCARKMLPPLQQARCIVGSWPFHPDVRQFGRAIKEKAGQLWRELVATTQ